MSLYSFFPMKKRKTQNVGTRRSTTSTLGKLKKSSDSPTAAGNGIEILWDNNSPSPTTTITLAGKRRRRPNAAREEESSITDVSFVVEKLSEHSSPVVDKGHSVLLEMWYENKVDQTSVPEQDFTSPPFRQTASQKTSSPFSTPLIQRRTSKRQSRKATKQFMLEIRKLVDEIQKSDLSGSSQSQKEIQCKIAEDQASVKRPKKNEECSVTVTPLTQSSTNGQQPCNANRASGTINSDFLLEDGFVWTEDDMDELILTCQLSSSGKGSLTIPEVPKPQCGLSPSQVILVPETQMTPDACAETQVLPEVERFLHSTQMLFDEEEPEVNTYKDVVAVLNAKHGPELCEHAQEVPEQNDPDKWELNSDDDDSLLASAAQEFELSREANTLPASRNSNTYHRGLAKRSPRKDIQNDKCSNGEIILKESPRTILSTTGNSSSFTKIANQPFSEKLDENPHRNSPQKNNVSKSVLGGKTTRASGKQSDSNHSTQSSKETLDASCGGNMSTPRGLAKMKLTLKRSTPAGNKASASFETRANENRFPRNNVRSQLRGNDGSWSPLRSIPGNMGYPVKHSRPQTKEAAFSKQTTQAKNCSSVKATLSHGRSTKACASNEYKRNLSEDKEENVKQNNKVEENDLDFLLCEDDVAALLDDFNFDDVLTEATKQTPVKKTCSNDVPKPRTDNSTRTLTTGSQKKYSKEEVEYKRLEAQRRRLAKTKQKNTTQSSYTYSRISKR